VKSPDATILAPSLPFSAFLSWQYGGWEMTGVSPRPLHRLTPLRDDPAAAWLSKPQRFRVTLTGWFAWVGFALFLAIMWWLLLYLILEVRVATVTTILSGLALSWPVFPRRGS